MPTPKLGARPKSFKRPVTFDLIEGGTATIVCSFRYRTRTEFSALIDQMFGEGSAQALDGEKFTFARMLDRETERSGEYLLQVLDGWDLADELNPANAQRCADELPGAVLAILEKYRLAITEGRLGN